MSGHTIQKLLSTRVGQSWKLPVKTLVGRLGYELTPVVPDEGARTRSMIAKSGIETLIDVGANQGQYARHMRALGFAGSIISYEPGSDAYTLLARNADLDPLWTIHHAALGAASGTATLNVANNSVSSSLLAVNKLHLDAAPESATRSVESVPMRRLDDAVASTPGKFWLKIDTQGYEMEVLKGAERILDRTEVVQLELSFKLLYGGQADWLQLMSYLKDRNYSVVDVIPGFRSPDGNLLQSDVILQR